MIKSTNRDNKLAVVIMAAGKGTRMDSDTPKVLHKLNGEYLISHVINTAKELNPNKIIVIVGYKAEIVKNCIDSNDILFSYQIDQKGTGHAVMQAKDHLKDFNGQTLVLSGDVPMIKGSTLKLLIKKQEENNFSACILTADLLDPKGYGRVIRNKSNNLKEVKEHKDCNNNELEIKEINSGIYVFNNKKLFELLPKLNNNNAQSEYYLPDVLTMMVSNGKKIGLEKIKKNIEIEGVNTLEQLSNLEKNYEKNN